MDKNEAKELARKAAMSRTKPNNRRTLTNSKDKSETGNKPVARAANMLSITGEECDGLQVSPSFITTFFLMFILAVVIAHIFTKGKTGHIPKDYPDYVPPVNVTNSTTGDL